VRKKKNEIVTRIGEVGGVVKVKENGVRNGGAEIERQRRIKFLHLVENEMLFNRFSWVLMVRTNKLECLPIAILFS
jgi:hypothetical protein